MVGTKLKTGLIHGQMKTVGRKSLFSVLGFTKKMENCAFLFD